MNLSRFAIAENRQAYATWCNRNGVKQNHAVYVREPSRLFGLTLESEQIIIIEGWEKNPRSLELRGALAVAAEQRAQE